MKDLVQQRVFTLVQPTSYILEHDLCPTDGTSYVFLNKVMQRQVKNMMLQTDPTVICGMGTAFDGNLRKRDLQTDTPWNTYMRNGLPPTPISMPGKAALLAAVQPAQSKSLYFVSRGDGTSQFSTSLDDHNRAVNRYQRGGGTPATKAAQ